MLPVRQIKIKEVIKELSIVLLSFLMAVGLMITFCKPEDSGCYSFKVDNWKRTLSAEALQLHFFTIVYFIVNISRLFFVRFRNVYLNFVQIIICSSALFIGSRYLLLNYKLLDDLNNNHELNDDIISQLYWEIFILWLFEAFMVFTACFSFIKIALLYRKSRQHSDAAVVFSFEEGEPL